MKKTINLTESDLHMIVKQVVNETLGDRLKGAVTGFQSGEQRQLANREDAFSLFDMVKQAKKVAATNDPQQALEFVHHFLEYAQAFKKLQLDRNQATDFVY